MKRVIDLSLMCRPFPAPMPSESLYTSHVEPVSKKRDRSKIFGYLDIEPFYVGRNKELIMKITSTVDPCPATHIESYYPERFFYPDTPEREIYVRDLSEIPVFELVGEGVIVDLSDLKNQTIDVFHLEKAGNHINKGDIVMIKTGFSDTYTQKKPHPDMYNKSPGFTIKAAEWLTKKDISAIGVDFRHLEAPEILKFKEFSVHSVFHLNKIPIIEDVTNLGNIKGERTFILCGNPLKVKGLTGGPARVVAIEKNTSRIIDLSHKMHAISGSDPKELISSTSCIHPIQQKSKIYKWLRIIPFNIWDFDLSASVGPQYVTFTTRLGTHLIAPYLDSYNSRDVMHIPLERIVGKASLVNLSCRIGPGQLITKNDIKETGVCIEEGDIVVVRTDFTDWYYYESNFLDITPSFSMEAIDWLIQKKISALVTDMGSVECQIPTKNKPPSGEIYQQLAKNGIPVVECATRLFLLQHEKFFIACLPLPIEGLEGSPVHVVAIEEWE